MTHSSFIIIRGPPTLYGLSKNYYIMLSISFISLGTVINLATTVDYRELFHKIYSRIKSSTLIVVPVTILVRFHHGLTHIDKLLFSFAEIKWHFTPPKFTSGTLSSLCCCCCPTGCWPLSWPSISKLPFNCPLPTNHHTKSEFLCTVLLSMLIIKPNSLSGCYREQSLPGFEYCPNVGGGGGWFVVVVEN